jgi:putative ABC transport system ATP-binding protein
MANAVAARQGQRRPGEGDMARREMGDRDGTILRCRGLHRTYRGSTRETAAVRGVDLEVEKGEWVAIMGPSGCGKSSLLHLLGGLDIPDAGTVEVAGNDLAKLSEAQRARLRRKEIGYVFQFFNLVQDFTVAENIELPMLLVGASRADAARRRGELLAAVGLADVASSMPAQLSGGQQQRVAIARALANHPKVLLADEPTGNLDTEAARQVLGLLRSHHATGQTIVMVTHDARVAAAADRVLVMEDGVFTGGHMLAVGLTDLVKGGSA